MTPEASLMVRVADALVASGIAYLLAGSVSSRQIWLPTPEDVIIMKLRWARSRDQDDVRAVMGVQGDRLDWSYIEGWCERHGTRALLEQIRRTVPKM